MHSTNFSQFGGKLFDATAKKLQLLRASRYWPDSPAKLWGSIGGAFLLLLIIMPFRDFLSLLVVGWGACRCINSLETLGAQFL
jgi:hypothetical protein